VPLPSYVVFLNGGYGVGKSSTLDHVGDLLAETGTAFSLFDVDWFHRSWPPAAHDPDNVLIEAENMAFVWNNYRSAGPRQPVVAGVIASIGDLKRYATTFALPVRSVRLTASARVIDARLRRRYTVHQSSSLRWHLDRHAELTEKQAKADLDEFVIATDERSPRSVAEETLSRFGLR
jgi:hypothetical protein